MFPTVQPAIQFSNLQLHMHIYHLDILLLKDKKNCTKIFDGHLLIYLIPREKDKNKKKKYKYNRIYNLT